MITKAEYAKLASAAYKDEGAPKGWERLEIRRPDNPAGYDGAAFKRKLSDGTVEVVIAHRGTEPAGFDGDWTANLQMGRRLVPDQYEYAKQFYERVKRENTDASITLTGHSLGGALAQLQAAQTGLHAETFNPYGAKTLIPALNEKYGLDLDPEATYSNITNHRTLFDGVSQIPGSAHLGDMDTHVAASELVGLIAVVATRSPVLLGALSGYWSHSADRFTNEIFPEESAAPVTDSVTQVGRERGAEGTEITTPLVETTRERISHARSVSSPILLDLDGDGIETTAVTAGAYFDHQIDGFAERTGWVGRDDGLLVLDRNGNGRIDDGGELFGSETWLTTGTDAGNKAANGFEALKELDANGDGQVDALDAAFADLRVWQDGNGDGLAQSNELHTLADVGVQSLATAYSLSTTVDAQGNAHKQIGSYTRTDGTQAAATDVWFATDTAYSIATDWRDVGGDIAALPELAGSGLVRDLHQAMAVDASGQLQAAVAAFAAEPDEGKRHSLAREIVLHWTGSAGIDPGSRGRYVDARELAAQERLTGQAFLQPGWGTNPGSTAGNRLSESFDELVTTYRAQLEAQTRYADLYSHAGLVWDGADASTPRLDLSGMADALLTQIETDRAAGLLLLDGVARNLAALGYVDEAGWSALGVSLGTAVPEATHLLSLARLPAHYGTDAADTLNGGTGDERLLGFGGDDVLAGKSGADVLEGGAGNDNLDGGAGNDTLQGGAGDDFLNGGSGSDTYLFSRGFGHDTLRQSDSAATTVDRAVFTDLSSDSLQEVVRRTDDLILGFGEAGQLTVADYFDSAARRVDLFEFADGTSWDVQAIKTQAATWGTTEADTLYGYNGAGNHILGLTGDDRLHGGDADDRLVGDEGNDRLYGKSGNDILDGGLGDDTLQGGNGNDTYRFNRGDGSDTWADYDTTAGNLDVASFGASIYHDQLWFTRAGNSLEASIIGSGDKVTIQNWYAGSAHRIERIEAGGMVLLESQVDVLVQAMAAFAPPAAGQTTLPSNYQQALAPVLAVNWQ